MVKHTSPFNTFFPSASAAKGVIAVEKPIPKDIAIKTKLFQETAANSVGPNLPTITLSTMPTMV
jgi:hypothetical protein